MPSSTSASRVSRNLRLVLSFFTLAAWSVVCASSAPAQTLTSLVSFNGTDGSNLYAGLVADAKGNLYGTTAYGGAASLGTLYEIPYDPSTGKYATAPITLVTFDGTNGAAPVGDLFMDNHGNLLGTTSFGGGAYGGANSGYGIVFELPYNATTRAYAAAPITLVTFDGTNGAFPISSLTADKNGDIFGTTTLGGATSNGTVFEIKRDRTTGTYATTPITLVSFTYTDGANPVGGLVVDASGNLFGTTNDGTPEFSGTVFEIPYNATTRTYATSLVTLVVFNGANGQLPNATLLLDAKGDLFGTTEFGGTAGLGTLFEVPFNATTHTYATQPSVLVNFDGSNGQRPEGGLIADANGNLFGTTYGASGGNTTDAGTIFELMKTSTGYSNIPLTLYSFSGTDGQGPYATLIANGQGDLFGTTFLGGVFGPYGTVFELMGSGFVPPRKFAGTPGKHECIEVSISALTHTYGGLEHAAATLGYRSVERLRDAVEDYCER